MFDTDSTEAIQDLAVSSYLYEAIDLIVSQMAVCRPQRTAAHLAAAMRACGIWREEFLTSMGAVYDDVAEHGMSPIPPAEDDL